MYMKRIVFLSLIVGSVFSSVVAQGVITPPNPKLTVSPASLKFPSAGGSKTATVNASSGKWTKTDPAKWLKLSINGNTITVTAEKNSGTSKRTTSFTVRSGNLSKTVNITQEAVKKTVPDPDKKTFTVKGVSFNMIKVQGGSAIVGCDSCYGNGKPLHKITLPDYYIGETEVTQALWKAVMGNNPSRFKGDNRPVENVSWYDCQEFIRKLNSLTKATFSLPTEAEWEYAARGGNKSKGYEHAGGNKLEKVGWYEYNSGNQTHKVKTKQPNELGLYDMSGNISEWCNDKCGCWRDFYDNTNSHNILGPTNGYYRRIRGGNWGYGYSHCFVYYRWASNPYYGSDYTGLRLVIDNIKKTNFQVPPTTMDFVDLGLPSGTLWKGCNENKYYSIDDTSTIFSKYGNQTPTIFDWQELLNRCSWSWTGDGYKVTGPNGKSIFLPADGFGDFTEGGPYGAGEEGYYYSSTKFSPETYYMLSFDSVNKTKESNHGYWAEFSVRLVKHGNQETLVKYIDRSDDGYIDLGLSSGTLWKIDNEPGYYTQDEAIRQFGGDLPTKKQLQELVDQCVFIWTGNGVVTVYGPNKQSIKLSAEGHVYCHNGKLDSDISRRGIECYYWSSTKKDSVSAWSLNIGLTSHPQACTFRQQRCAKYSVRLVKRKKKLKNMIVPYEK